jgi:hypothetical protein
VRKISYLAFERISNMGKIWLLPSELPSEFGILGVVWGERERVEGVSDI